MRFIPSSDSFSVWLLLGISCWRAPFVTASSSNNVDSLSADVKALVQTISSHSGETDAGLWRRLGKTQLDAGEYAEARRIFCCGATICPTDEGLQHHAKVWETFHGEDTIPFSSNIPPTLDRSILEKPDLFLNLDVPTEAIPASVRAWNIGDCSSEPCNLIHASKEPILSKQACQFLIDAALKAAAKRGWTKDRHIQAPTCDIPVFDLPADARYWCRKSMGDALLPLLAKTVAPELKVDSKDLHIQDFFVVRYDGEGNGEEESGPGFGSLRPHEDESLLSLTIALNDMNNYEGGGLFIECTGDLLNGDAGTVLCFPGQLTHGGYPVSKGTRWILTAFLYVDANESGKPRGYTLDVIKELKQQRQKAATLSTNT